jgi:TonB family protein
MSTAGDIWGLGITLVEALTQTPPAWSRESSESVSLPANIPPEFVHTVQRCLNREPGHRPTIFELAAQFKRAPPATPASATPPAMTEPWVPTPSTHNSLETQSSPKTRRLVTAITVFIVTLCAVWTVVHLFRNHAGVRQTASITPPAPPPVSPPAAVEIPKASIAAPLPTVLHQEMPDVSRSARASIRGIIKIAVRVMVDRSGNVVAATLANGASSRYFTRAALDAAKKWKFSQSPDQASQVWLLHFEFTRAGATAHGATLR